MKPLKLSHESSLQPPHWPDSRSRPSASSKIPISCRHTMTHPRTSVKPVPGQSFPFPFPPPFPLFPFLPSSHPPFLPSSQKHNNKRQQQRKRHVHRAGLKSPRRQPDDDEIDGDNSSGHCSQAKLRKNPDGRGDEVDADISSVRQPRPLTKVL
jgi:hypothetical protein